MYILYSIYSTSQKFGSVSGTVLQYTRKEYLPIYLSFLLPNIYSLDQRTPTSMGDGRTFSISQTSQFHHTFVSCIPPNILTSIQISIDKRLINEGVMFKWQS